MDKVLVVVFDSEKQADDGVKALEDLCTEGSIALHRQAVIAKDADGRPTIKVKPDRGSYESAGLVIAADYLEAVASQLEPGKAAVVAEVQEEQATSVDSRMGEVGGAVFRQDAGEIFYAQVERDLMEIDRQLDTLAADLDQESAGAGTKLQARIDAEKAEIRKTSERVRTRLEATQREAEAKIAALKEQAASADAERKQQLEMRLAEVQADHTERTAKLRRALEHARKALDRTGRGEDDWEPKAMEADVTEEGGASNGHQLIERVYEEMIVVDADGKELGKVALVRMGDPEAGSLEGQWRDEVRILDSVFVEGEPDLPRELRHSLLRMGFLKVDRRGFLGIVEKRHYIRSDEIAGVSGGRVTLTVAEAQLPADLAQPGPIRS